MLGAILVALSLSGGSDAVPALPGTARPSLEARQSARVALPGGEALAGFDEAELVLSLDGGASYPIRVSRRLDTGAGEVEWVVPALPSHSARLGLRAGRKGAETLVAVSAGFAIHLGDGVPPERVVAAVNDLWTEEAAREASVPPSFPAGLGQVPSLLEGATEPTVDDDDQLAPLLLPVAGEDAPLRVAPVFRPPPAVAPSLPLVLPLRE